MRLDHLLSKEEEVRVVLLFICPRDRLLPKESMRQVLAGCRCRARTDRCRMTKDVIGRTAEREVMRSITESREFDAWTDKATIILVAMRLGDTPVLIPNTMVKT